MRLKFFKIFFILLPIFLSAEIAQSQVTINFNPAIYGQSLDGLSYVQVFNASSENVRIKLTIKIKETTAGNVLTAVINSVPLYRGINTIDRGAFSAGRFSFGNNYYGNTLSQTGKFPEGDYEYCFEVEITDSKASWNTPFFENCFSFQLQPLTPLLLINPVDGDEDCNTRPDFLWQLPMPLPPGSKCRMVLSEINEKQDIVEAINYNVPLINRGNLFSNQLQFPFNAPQLKEGKRYAWQVTVYNEKTILKKSEIWTYTVKCEEKKEQSSGESFRELKETEDGNFYVANKILRFSFNNPYSGGILTYAISSLSDPGSTIKSLPTLKMQAGLNKYEIDLSDNRSFKNGKEYLLKVTLTNNRELRLRFIYKDE